MKYILAISVILSLTACSMSIEEYNARVKYCIDSGMNVKVFHQTIPENAVNSVRCVNKDGATFSSKEAK